MIEKFLQSILDGELSLHELSSQCSSVKQLGKVQTAFIKATNCTDWNEATERFPDHVTPEKLES